MSAVVHIVDYGVGNLYSVARAIEAVGGTPKLTSDASEIDNADRLLLPGVGAFAPCMAALTATGLVEPVLEFARAQRPFLGICVGMQLLFEHSVEFGRHRGLGLIAGQVEAIPTADAVRKVPHIGWSALHEPADGHCWRETILEGAIPGVTSAYFVHSFNCVPDDPRIRLADVDYMGYRICAAVKSGNVTAFQCHPEKSGPAGLRILRNFLDE